MDPTELRFPANGKLNLLLQSKISVGKLEETTAWVFVLSRCLVCRTAIPSSLTPVAPQAWSRRLATHGSCLRHAICWLYRQDTVPVRKHHNKVPQCLGGVDALLGSEGEPRLGMTEALPFAAGR